MSDGYTEESSVVDRLTRVRDRLAALLETADERTAPALSREYRSVLVDLEKLGVKEASNVDDLAARRAARIAESETPDSAEVRQ